MFGDNSSRFDRSTSEQWTFAMEMPLFPLGVVLFPGMVLPLHIFEPRYREMIKVCVEERTPFGVVLIREGQEVGGNATPHPVGTAARITKLEKLPDGRMKILVRGTRRFRLLEVNRSREYLTGRVTHYPVVNGDTRLAVEQAQRVRPKIVNYVDLLSRATGVQLDLDRLSEDPTALAFLTAIALQVNPNEKQRILSLAGVPAMLDLGNYFLAREIQLLQHMIDSHPVVERLTSGPTGYLFAN